MQKIHENARVEINVGNKRYTAFVVNHSGDYVSVTLPDDNDAPKTLERFKPYTIVFFMGASLHSYEAQITEYSEERKSAVIELLSEVTKIQRRSYYRYSCILPFNFYTLEQSDMGAYRENKLCAGLIQDISEGGLRFVSKEDLENDTMVKCLLDLEKEPFIIKGVLLNKGELVKSNYKFEYRVKFGDDTESVIMQDKIVRFIFEEQMRKIRAERLNKLFKHN